MSDIPTKEQIKAKKDKEAVAAMKAAKTNMESALSRINTLEGSIANLSSLVEQMMEHVHEKSFPYGSNESFKDRFKKLHAAAKQYV